MAVLFGIKMLIDYLYYMFAVASLSTCAPHSGMLLTSPIICAAASALCYFAASKKPGSRAFKYIPILLTGACFIFTRHLGDKIITVPMILYLAFVMYRNITYIEYNGATSRFYLCLKILPVPLLLTVIASNKSGFINVMLPYMFLFLTVSVMFMRMLRHNDKVYTDKKFITMNLAEIAGLCGLGWLFSSGMIVAAFKWVVHMIAMYILRPILYGILYVFGGIAWLLDKIFGNINFDFSDIDFSQLTEQLEQGNEAEQNAMEMMEESTGNGTAAQITTYVLLVIGAIIVVLLIILLFRALAKMGRKNDDNEFGGVREAIAEDDGNSQRRLGFSPRDRVRHYYRKFLKQAYKIGVDENANYCSIDIQNQVRNVMHVPAMRSLRGVYLKARYSSNEITQDDVKEAKNAYDGLKKRDLRAGGE